MKKYSAIALLFFSLFSVQAKALTPLLLLLGGGGTAIETAVAASVAIHAAVIGIAFKDEISGVISPAAAPFQVNLAPKVADRSTVPAGWAAGASQYDAPISPASYPLVTSSENSPSEVAYYTGAMNSQVEAAQTANTGMEVHCTTTIVVHNAVLMCSFNGGAPSQLGNYAITQVTTNNCGAGYSVSGANCVKTNPAAVVIPADSKQTVKRSGNSLAVPTNDSDPVPSGAVVTPQSVTYTDPSSGGVTTITTDSGSGSSKVTYQRYDAALGKTLTDTFNLDAPTSAESTSVSVSGVSHSESTGGGSLASAAGGTLTGSSSAATGADSADGSNAIVNKLEELKNSATLDAERECARHPERLNCKDAGTMDDTELLTNVEKNVAITPISVSSAAGVCPADKSFTASNGYHVVLSYAPVCSGATSVRPIVIALAWLSAALLLIGASKRDS